MNFLTYIGKTAEEFEKEYLDTRLVNSQKHPEFPLTIYTYGRETVHGSLWDSVTRKCRGIIVHSETWEIVARPFEKFFNLGSEEVPDCTTNFVETLQEQPYVWEKVDGFLCTGYQWEGKWYAASKGSFTSPHAKWATAQIQKFDSIFLLRSQTPVFEGVSRNLRIVVDYGEAEELVLLALIETATGKEEIPYVIQRIAGNLGISTPELESIDWRTAHQNSYDETIHNAEGYVLTWYKKDAPPFRLKVKFADYLRLHRMVTGVSPKRVLEVIQNGWATELNDLLNDSTPWFSKFVAKWKRVIEGERDRILGNSNRIMARARMQVAGNPFVDFADMRKQFAMIFNQPENKEFSGVLFAMLDGKDVPSVIWKKVKNSPMMKGGKPMIDGHNV